MQQNDSSVGIEELRTPSDVVDVSEFFGDESFEETFVTLTNEEVDALQQEDASRQSSLTSFASD